MKKNKKIILSIFFIVILILIGVEIGYNEFGKKEVTNTSLQTNQISEIYTYSSEGNEIKETNESISYVIDLEKFDIIFLGNEEFYINYKGKEIELRNSLINKTITIDEVIEQAENDYKNEIASKHTFLDGGSVQYKYKALSIIKMNSFDGNRNVYIGNEKLNINDL